MGVPVFRSAGDPADPAVLLVHGYPASSHMWRPALAALAARGLHWACDHPDAVWAVVASDTGFFPDGRWHGLADALRTPGQGEQLVDEMTLEAFTAMLRSISTGIGPEEAREYFKAF